MELCKGKSMELSYPNPNTSVRDPLNVTNTSIVVAKKNDEGKFINQYMVVEDLGRFNSL